MKSIERCASASPLQASGAPCRGIGKHLGTYLNDHLAASVTAIHLLSRLEAANSTDGLPGFAKEMRNEVERDQSELKDLMSRLHIRKSRGRMATAWFGHKLTWLKFQLDDPHNRGLRTLELLELVEIGVEGKHELWQALSSTAKEAPALQGPDYDRLTQRARDQHDRLESFRLATARKALLSPL